MTDIEDPIADAILDDTGEALIYRSSWVSQPVALKLGYIAAILASFVLTIPLVLTSPPDVFEGTTFATATPKPMLLALIAIGILVVCSFVLVAVQVARRRLELTNEQTYSTYIIEDMASLLAFVPGTGLLVFSESIVVVLYRGRDAVETYVQLFGADPTVQSPVALPIPTVAVVALVCGAGIYALSQYSASLDDR